jgi:hypothetical protein
MVTLSWKSCSENNLSARFMHVRFQKLCPILGYIDIQSYRPRGQILKNCCRASGINVVDRLYSRIARVGHTIVAVLILEDEKQCHLEPPHVLAMPKFTSNDPQKYIYPLDENKLIGSKERPNRKSPRRSLGCLR